MKYTRKHYPRRAWFHLTPWFEIIFVFAMVLSLPLAICRTVKRIYRKFVDCVLKGENCD